MHIAIIGGASTIGSTVANAIIAYRQDLDVSLIDPDVDAATGHATDLAHGMYHHAEAPTGQGVSTPRIRGIHPDDVDEIDPDLAIVAADKPRQIEGNLDRGFRDERIDRIEDMLANITEQLRTMGPLPVINATNPLDRVLYYFWKRLGWDREHFLGYSLSESARIADAIGQVKDVHPNRVSCPTLGEHGQHVVLLFSRTNIGGESVEFSPDEKAEIREYVQEIPIRIANNRGLEESSRWVTSAGVLRVLRSMESENHDRPLCLSVPLAGEYGFDTGCLSLPVHLGSHGFEKIVEWELTPDERDRLETAHEAIVETLPDIDS